MTCPNSWFHLIRVAAVGVAVATSGSVAHAQAGGQIESKPLQRQACSNATLKGAYAFDIVGVFVDAPTPLPLRGVAVTQFDGSAPSAGLTVIPDTISFTGRNGRCGVGSADVLVFNGTPPPVDWTQGTGWYEINADCTGQAVIEIPGSPFSPVTLRLSVGANGTHVNTVVSKAGYVVGNRSLWRPAGVFQTLHARMG